MVRGMKRLEKESLRKARLDLCQRLSALQLGQNTTLSVSAKPFVPLATSSQMGINGSGTNGSGTQGYHTQSASTPVSTPPRQLSGTGVPRRPPVSSSSEDEETTTDGTTTDSSIIPAKKGSHKRAKEGKRKRKGLGVKLVKVALRRTPQSLLGKVAVRRLELQTKSTSQNSQVLLISLGR